YDPRLLVLVNGRQVYLDHYGMTNWAGLGVQLEEVQQIEIIRGPNSALFGFNAVSGVVNIITINPLQTEQLVTSVEGGTKGYGRLSQSAAIRLADRLGIRLSGGYEKSDELAGLNGSTLAPQYGTIDPRKVEAAGELYGAIDDRTNGSLSASYSDSRYLVVSHALLTIPTSYEFGSVGARVLHDTGWGLLSGQVLHNWSNLDIAIPVIPGGVTVRNEVSIASADALVRAGAANTLRFGLEYRRDQLRTVPGYPGLTRYAIYAASAMWERRLGDAITVTAAARIDHLTLDQSGVVDQPTIFTKADFDRSIAAFSFNSAILFKLDDTSSLRVAASRGIQAPSLDAFGTRVQYNIPGLPIPYVASGNPAIRPAIITSAEIGFNHSFEAMSSRLELTAFYNRTTDIISLSAPQTPPIATPPAYPFILAAADNVGSFTAFGVEASLTGRFGQAWRWALNYSWTRAEQNIVGNMDGRFDWPLALDSATPEHKIKAQISYEHGAWLATTAARYTSAIAQLVEIPVTPTTGGPLTLVAIKQSVALDAKLAFKASSGVTLSVAGENLTGARGTGLSPAPAERRLRGAVQISF
ncbi:MAG: TonB-dependent receptor plug, partial [Rhizorhabdus sp.]|nr:TonB-dependent receptor plug [Rhizorhabdus sp.]